MNGLNCGHQKRFNDLTIKRGMVMKIKIVMMMMINDWKLNGNESKKI